MKKKREILFPFGDKMRLRIRKMKLTVLLTFLVIATFGSGFSQVTLSLHFEKASIQDVLQSIEKKTDYIFMYKDDIFHGATTISVDFEDAKFEEVLKSICDQTNVDYEVRDRQIILKERVNLPMPPAEQQPQKKEITGSVKDSKGQSLPGVSVVVKGTTIGIITDVNGKFKIDVPQSAKTLAFSFIGMKNQEIVMGENSTFNVTLGEESVGLDEVVAVGYGTQKKKDVIGSVATVMFDDAVINPSTSSVTEMLQGRASGLFVSNGGVLVRGVNSISNSTAPLFVVDGIISGGGYVNPNDIESIEVLKDAAATSIYGSLASGGVIMIITKTGKKGSSMFNVIANTGVVSFMNSGFSMSDGSTHLGAMDLAIQNQAKYDPSVAVHPYDPKDGFTGVKFLTDEDGKARNFDYFTRAYCANINTNQLKALTRKGNYNDINLLSSKSFDNGGLNFSIHYRNNKDQLLGGYSNSLDSRFGINWMPAKNLNFGITSTLNYNKVEYGTQLNMNWLPYMPLYDPKSPTGLWVTAANPLSLANHGLSDDNTTNFGGSIKLYGEYLVPFVKGLSVKANLGGDIGSSKSVNWSSPMMNLGTNRSSVSAANETGTNALDGLANLGLDYNRKFGDHSFNAVLYQEASLTRSNFMYSAAQNLSSEFHEIYSSPGTLLSMSTGMGGASAMSTLGRLSYKYKDRYLLEGSLRHDATSNFSPNKRNASFYSLGAGWIISDESFFKNAISWMNLLKIRGSIGQTGNGNMPSFAYLSNYIIKKQFMNLPYTLINNLGNPFVEWETSNNTDVGIDYGFLGNKINGSVAYYKKNVNGLLLQVPLPLSSGLPVTNSVWQNIGDMTNTGIEINVGYVPIKTSNFTWKMTFNFTSVKNNIVALHPGIDIKGWGIQGVNSITRKGGKLASFYLPEFAGIDPQKGIPMIYEVDQAVYATSGRTVKTGNLVPLNSVTGAANRIIENGKSSVPDWYGGFSNNFRYKDFTLDMNFTYAGNFYFVDQAAIYGRTIDFGSTALFSNIITNSWKQPGDKAMYPEIIYGGGSYYDDNGQRSVHQNSNYRSPTTQDLIKGNYMKLKLITLGYNLPHTLISKMKISSLRVYFSINNALTFTKVPEAIDPEMNINGNLDGTSVYYGVPPSRTYSLGFSLNF